MREILFNEIQPGDFIKVTLKTDLGYPFSVYRMIISIDLKRERLSYYALRGMKHYPRRVGRFVFDQIQSILDVEYKLVHRLG